MSCVCVFVFVCTFLLLGRYQSPRNQQLPPLARAHSGQPHSPPVGPQYEWVDVGMFDYNPQTKLYLVKRVFVPDHVTQKDKSGSSSTHSLGSAGSSEGSSSGEGSDGTRISDGRQGEEAGSNVAPAKKHGKVTKRKSKKSVQQKPKGERHEHYFWECLVCVCVCVRALCYEYFFLESEDDIHYWVPRVRLMFSAEDPIVFARRVCFAHDSRQNTEALLR